MRILMVEDNIEFVELLKEYFDERSYFLTHTDSVSVAKKILSESAFDLLILDLHLSSPSGEYGSGIDVVHFARERMKLLIPIVIVTGLELVSKKVLLDQGVTRAYNKPLDMPFDQFVDELASLIPMS